MPPTRALLVAILLGAVFLRLHQLDTLPPGMHYDEAYYALDAREALRSGPKLFYEGNTGRESLYINLISVVIALLGSETYGLRLISAMLGVATVAVTFALGRTMFRSLGVAAATRIGLVGAGLLAVSHWQVDINRMILRANTMPLTLAIAFFLLWKAAHDSQTRAVGASWWRRRQWFVAAGAMFGVAFYAYISMRTLPVVLLGLIAVEIILSARDRAFPALPGRSWLTRQSFAPFLVAASIVMAPLAIYYALHPDLFLGRATYVSALGPSGGDNRLLALTDSLVGNLAVFGLEGDGNLRHNLPGKPVFNPPIFALFLVGVVFCLAQLRRGPFLQLFAWQAALMIPGIVATDEYPHYTRIMGIVPGLYLLPALGVEAVIRVAKWTQQRALGWRTPPLPIAPVGGVALALLIVGNGAQTYRDYFTIWAANPDVYFAMHGEMADAARLMNRLGDSPDTVFLLPFNFRLKDDYDHRTIDFLYHGRAAHRFLRVEEATLPERVAAATAGFQQAYLLHWKAGDHWDADPKELAPFQLLTRGDRVETLDTRGAFITRYRLGSPTSGRHLGGETPVQSDIGGLSLVAARVPEESDGRSLIVLRWQTTTRLRADYSVSAQLIDPDGRRYVQADRPLLSNDLFPTSQWPANFPAQTYLELDGMPGAQPGRYLLRVVVYESRTGAVVGAADAVASIVIDGTGRSAPFDERFALTPSQGNALVAAPEVPEFVRPGQTFEARVLVRGGGSATASVSAVWHDAAGATLTTVTTTARFGAGPLALVALPLTPPPFAQSGSTTLVIRVADGEARAVPGPVIVDRPRTFALPSDLAMIDARFGNGVRLVGWRPESPCLTSGQACAGAVTFSLVWQADGPTDRPFSYFVHLVGADSRPMSQVDAIPGDGLTPTNTLRPGEVIEQRVTLRVPSLTTGDTLRVVTGWYDAAGARAAALSGGDVALVTEVRVR